VTRVQKGKPEMKKKNKPKKIWQYTVAKLLIRLILLSLTALWGLVVFAAPDLAIAVTAIMCLIVFTAFMLQFVTKLGMCVQDIDELDDLEECYEIQRVRQ
jgi:O-antigen/teichoic acid export membrane protein